MLYAEGDDPGTEALHIDLTTLKVATRNFSDKLGEGGFGKAYKLLTPNYST